MIRNKTPTGFPYLSGSCYRTNFAVEKLVNFVSCQIAIYNRHRIALQALQLYKNASCREERYFAGHPSCSLSESIRRFSNNILLICT